MLSKRQVADMEVQCVLSPEFRNQESQTLPTSNGDVRQQMQSSIKQTDPDDLMNLDKEPSHKMQHQ
jgi:hypothetical protein